ncbi:MAG: condensation domain-containing protein [Xenococcaceae cyanobacterium]
MKTFRRRINTLSPKKQTLLSLRLRRQLTSPMAREEKLDNPSALHHQGKRLIAYIVPEATKMGWIEGEQSIMDLPELDKSDLRSYLKARLPDYMIPSIFLQLDALPRTPNGKVDPQALPAPDTAVSALETPLVAPRTPIEEILAGIWAEVLGLEEISIHDNFFEVGGDSILSIQIVSRTHEAGLSLMPNQLFEHQTIAELAAVIVPVPVVQAEQELVTGSVPLTPIQHWFFEQHFLDPHHWNQSVLLEVPLNLDFALLEQAVEQLWLHHDALRLSFIQNQIGWEQLNAGEDATISIARLDLSTLSEEEQRLAIEKHGAALQASLNLAEGGLMRLAFFNLGEHRLGRLLIIIHHLAVDSISWRILLEDLETLYNQLRRGDAIQLPPKTSAFKYWAEKLVEYAASDVLRQESHDWLNLLEAEIVKIPVDNVDNQTNTEASAQTISAYLSIEETRALLKEVPAVYNTQINDVLLTALVQAVSRWAGAGTLMVDLEGHGREEIVKGIDLSRTVGWFTSFFPVPLSLGNLSHPGTAIKSIKEQLRQIPNRGLGYGLLRYLSGDVNLKAKLEKLPQAEILFKYLEPMDRIVPQSSLFRLTREVDGASRSPQNRRSHRLEIDAQVVDGQLQLDWTYSWHVHQPATIEKLVQDFMEALRGLIAHCMSPETGGFTPSDFPEADLSQDELDLFIGSLTQGS